MLHKAFNDEEMAKKIGFSCIDNYRTRHESERLFCFFFGHKKEK